MAGCSPNQSSSDKLDQTQVNTLAKDMDVSLTVKSNVNVENCPSKDNNQCYLAELTLTFPQDINSDDWKIYFSNTSPIAWDGSNEFDITRINGDLHTIVPKLSHYKAGQTYTIPFKGNGWRTAESDFTPNYILVAGDLAPRVIAATQEVKTEDRQIPHMPFITAFETPAQTERGAKDNTPLATADWLYDRHAQINAQMGSATRQSIRVIPKLQQASWQPEHLNTAQGLSLDADTAQRFEAAVELLQDKQIALSDQGIKVNVTQSKQTSLGDQGYKIDVTPQSINITANHDAGVFYALVTLGQVIEQSGNALPLGEVTDVPRYDFRGLHMDISRNFHSKALILKVIKQLGAYKINKLHLHMADDEGWRLEIPGLPELTDVGAYRCFDLSEQSCLSPQLGAGPDKDSPVNGYLTTQDYIDILKYAAARQIEVIPAIDMPGHSRAAVKAMQVRYNKYIQSEQSEKATEFLLSDLDDKSQYSSIQHYNDNTLNPCVDSTYKFIEKIIDEVTKLHQKAGVPLRRYHIGADETAGAWNDSPACKKLIADTDELDSTKQLTPYFVAKVARLVESKGLIAGAWSDGLSHVDAAKLPANTQSNVWDTLFWQGHNGAQEMANRGWDTILSLPDMLYFDFPYQKDPQEPGYYWGSRSTDSFELFEFMPENLPAHAEIWPDNMGNPYTAADKTPKNEGVHFTGIQAQFWSETIRADSTVEYMLFPRLIAFAERAWHTADWALPYRAGQTYSQDSKFFDSDRKADELKDWSGFSHTMVQYVMPALAQDDILFRMPTPGVKNIDGKLHANSYYPGLSIEYKSADSSEWMTYEQPIDYQPSLLFRSTLAGTDYHSRYIRIK
ncbi:family 20 glycosylhydrolase [Neptunicella marina]|uniref:beta-N-acetylhexosaminidase n=1 Tax=Neptunicella marina TaxID=2125989 RepID=A0A8J6M1T1_9ALTE|nr:family 20 glycosylhydrolase [Neptunicella marina]MBC3765712.1 carbohydate-binding domain-containing protein [Neptunicella marina]